MSVQIVAKSSVRFRVVRSIGAGSEETEGRLQERAAYGEWGPYGCKEALSLA